MKQKSWFLIIIFICVLLLLFGTFYFSGNKNNSEITDEITNECPTGFTYAKGGLPGDNAPYYCVEETSENGQRPIIIPMSPYPTQ